MPYFENTTRDMALPFMIILNLLTIFMQVFPKCHAADEYFFLTSFMITIRRFRFISHHTFFFPGHKYGTCKDLRFLFMCGISKKMSSLLKMEFLSDSRVSRTFQFVFFAW